MMRQGIKHQLVVSREVRGQNSHYKGKEVNLKHVRPWRNFVTWEELSKFLARNPILEKALNRLLTDEEKSQFCTNPNQGRLFNETDLDGAWRANVHTRLNLIFRLCAHDLKLDCYPELSGGADATWISSDAEPGSQGKKPDFSGSEHDAADPDFPNRKPEAKFNRIPGECKMSGKFGSRFIPPNGDLYIQRTGLTEARKVLSQIHCYMDRSEARYGYIVTDEELIFLRRRGAGWGQLDVSRPIPHDGTDKDPLNSLYVMFYMHWKYARDNESWRLRSFGKFTRNRMKRAAGKRTDKLPKECKIC